MVVAVEVFRCVLVFRRCVNGDDREDGGCDTGHLYLYEVRRDEPMGLSYET